MVFMELTILLYAVVIKGISLKSILLIILHMSDVTFDMSNNSITVHQNNVEPGSYGDTGVHDDGR